MKVADERRGAAGVEHPLLDLGHGRRRFREVYGHAHHLRPGLPQLDALLRRRLRVRRIRHRHGLHDHRCATANGDIADADADGAMSLPYAKHNVQSSFQPSSSKPRLISSERNIASSIVS